jgi:hypothetical protein
MSDKEIIARSLREVQRRLTTNQVFTDVSRTFAVFLLFPLVLKICDLIYPFRAIVVFPTLGVWLVALAAYSISLMRPRRTLLEAAASVDKRLMLQGELTTACWFIQNPKRSEWVDRQIQRAAAAIRKVDPARLYPRFDPASSFIAGGILVLFVFLNFSPLSGNRNWFALQAAPAYALSDTEQQLFERAQILLKGTPEGERLEAVMAQFQAGEVSLSEALAELAGIHSALQSNRLDVVPLTGALAEVGRELQGLGLFKDTGAELEAANLPEAAKNLVASADKLDQLADQSLNQAQESLERASTTSVPELKNLSAALKEVASSLVQNNLRSARVGLSKAAEEFQLFGSLIHNQEFKDEGAKQLQQLMNTMRQRPYAEGGIGSGAREGIGYNSAPPNGAPSSDNPAGNEASGTQASAGSGGNPPRVGPPTSLRVQLQREQVRGQRDQASKETEPSRKETSTAGYTSIQPDFRPIPKDLMNRGRIPREYRPLIKEYFDALDSSQ